MTNAKTLNCVNELSKLPLDRLCRMLSLREMQIAAAPSILKRCLAKQPFSTLDVWNDTPKLRDEGISSITLGMALGTSDQNGLKLLETGSGFRAVFENAFSAVQVIAAEGLLSQTVDALGLSPEECLERVGELEVASDRGKAMRADFREIIPDRG